MKIFLTGDTHIPYDTKKLNIRSFPEQKSLTKEDFVIILGDFGLLWYPDKEYLWWKRWFDDKPFTTLWIDGNHENHEWINTLPVSEWNGGKVHYISPSIIHLMRGQVFTLAGKTFFTFGGAASHDKEHRKENIDWWPQEEAGYTEQMEGLRNLEAYHNQVDYVLSHTCPDELIGPMFQKTTYPTPTGKYLSHVAETTVFRHWYFGHWHISKTYEKYTVLYNTVQHLT